MTDSRFPQTRLRRNRRDGWTRRLVAENTVSVDDLIWPIFLREGSGEATEVSSMPGVVRVTLDGLAAYVEPAIRLGIPAVAFFPATAQERKNAEGTEATNPKNLVCSAARLLKAEFPDLGLVGDVALDPYTDHGHDGVIRQGYVANDETLEVLARQAVVQAEAGIDVIAPSDMMDGRVAAIRAALDASGLIHTKIMSYAAKYASAFYGAIPGCIGQCRIAEGRQEDLSNGSGQFGRGAARSCDGHRRGRRHDHGQARNALSGHHPPRGGPFRGANLRLSGVGRIRDDHGGGAQWLAG